MIHWTHFFIASIQPRREQQASSRIIEIKHLHVEDTLIKATHKTILQKLKINPTESGNFQATNFANIPESAIISRDNLW